MKKNHPFHLVEISPWPLISALGSMSLMTSMINWFYYMNNDMLIMSILLMLLITAQWWRDIMRESTLQGLHLSSVVNGLRWGMILFITSEVMFFVSFFWSFFHSSLTPSIEIGMLWPPKSILPFEPLQIPLINTLILISSGVTITWSHHSLMENNLNQAIISLGLTIILGINFSTLQLFEYLSAPFSMNDSVYGSTFYMATGFHGLHVIIGTTFLMVTFNRLMFNHFSATHHFGFEAAAWYWHFVDVVWLFLYLTIYWWSK
nr:cytochrome c oxidase subunit III [Microrhagus sp. ZM-2022]